jgi:Domain of unknown function (DUF5753)
LACYESELAPGLLQSEDYARRVIQADNPGADEEEINRRPGGRTVVSTQPKADKKYYYLAI